MSEIKRHDVDERNALSEVVEAGDFIFLSFCVGNVGQSVEAQVNGALDDMAARLEKIGLTLESVVKVDVMMKDPWNIPVMEKVFQDEVLNLKNQGKTILLSSHILSEVEKLADKISIIKQGKIVIEGEMKNIAKKGETLEELFLSEFEG